MKTTQRILLIVLALSLALSLCACGGGGGGKSVDLGKAAQDLIDAGIFEDFLNQPADGVAARIYGFNESDVKNCVLYTGTGATAEEIFLAEAASSSAASSLEQLCRNRIANQRSSFESYVPAEVPKLDSAVVMVSGNYVFCVVSNDAATAQSILNGYLNG